MEHTVLISITGFYYVSGQGGTPYMLDDLSNVTHAQVTGVSGTIGETRSYGQVNAISLASGSLYNGSSTVYAMTNEVVLQLSTNVGGTITELSTGTVSGTISLIAQGF